MQACFEESISELQSVSWLLPFATHQYFCG
jgi:hypothetical protein